MFIPRINSQHIDKLWFYSFFSLERTSVLVKCFNENVYWAYAFGWREWGLAFCFMATNDPIQGKTSIFKPTNDYLNI